MTGEKFLLNLHGLDFGAILKNFFSRMSSFVHVMNDSKTLLIFTISFVPGDKSYTFETELFFQVGSFFNITVC